MERPVTLITGTSRGIGRFLAEHYLNCGHTVIGCSRGDTDLEEGCYLHVSLDVTDEASVKELFGRIRRSYGRLDHLVNNAGKAAMNHSLLTPISSVSEIVATNFIGTFLFSREAAKLMRRNAFGRIVNMASVAVPLKLEGEAAYAASKAAVISLTQILARELAEFGITVNAVGPNPIATSLVAGVPDEKIKAVLRRQAIAQMGTPADVANVIDFFFRAESSFVTGQCLYLGGV